MAEEESLDVFDEAFGLFLVWAMAAVDEFEVGVWDLATEFLAILRGINGVGASPDNEGWGLEARESGDSGAGVEGGSHDAIGAFASGGGVEGVEEGVDALGWDVVTGGVDALLEKSMKDASAEGLFEQ